MKKITSFIKRFGFLILPLMLPVSAFAFVVGGGGGPGPATQPDNATAPPSAGINTAQGLLNLICAAFDYAFYFLIALAVVFGVIAAYRYLTSSGESEKVKKAGHTLLYAAIAVGVALLARGIPLIVADVLGAGSSGGASDIGACGAY